MRLLKRAEQFGKDDQQGVRGLSEQFSCKRKRTLGEGTLDQRQWDQLGRYQCIGIKIWRVILPRSASGWLTFVSSRLELHPLALEDVLHTTAHKRSKVDYYTKHLFIRVLCHSLARDGEFTLLSTPVYDTHPTPITALPRSSSPDPFNDRDVKVLSELPIEVNDDDHDQHESLTVTPKRGLRARFLGDVEKGPLRRNRTWQRLGLLPKSVSIKNL